MSSEMPLLILIQSYYILKNRQDACSTKTEFSCGVGILLARKRLINHDSASPLRVLQEINDPKSSRVTKDFNKPFFQV
ncbi:hypothetical protein QT994_18365, partial [Microcoleus sp. S13_B4]